MAEIRISQSSGRMASLSKCLNSIVIVPVISFATSLSNFGDSSSIPGDLFTFFIRSYNKKKTMRDPSMVLCALITFDEVH